jgi:hypothetical protein
MKSSQLSPTDWAASGSRTRSNANTPMPPANGAGNTCSPPADVSHDFVEAAVGIGCKTQTRQQSGARSLARPKPVEDLTGIQHLTTIRLSDSVLDFADQFRTPQTAHVLVLSIQLASANRTSGDNFAASALNF